jgi:hypothetical protein
MKAECLCKSLSLVLGQPRMGWKGFRLPLERQAEKASVFLPQKDKYFLYKLCHEQKKKNF